MSAAFKIQAHQKFQQRVSVNVNNRRAIHFRSIKIGARLNSPCGTAALCQASNASVLELGIDVFNELVRITYSATRSSTASNKVWSHL